MLTSKELRLGNWVITKTAYDKPTEIQVHSIGASGINLLVNSGVHENDIEPEIVFDDLEGIELTEKHLLAWGFTSTGSFANVTSELYSNGHIVIGYDAKEKTAYFGTDMHGERRLVTAIKTVHHFQNLIYDLTNEEII